MIGDVLAMLATMPAAALGAAYPDAAIDQPPHASVTTDAITGRRECFIGYRLRTAAAIAPVAAFYKAQGAAAGARLIEDTGGKLPDFRILAFATPHFLSVVLARQHASTRVAVTYGIGCP